MARTSSRTRQRIKALRDARKAVQKLARASYLKALQADLSRLDRRIESIPRQVAQGKLTKAVARSTLSSLKRMRKDGQRYLARVSLTKEQALRSIDQTLSELMEG